MIEIRIDAPRMLQIRHDTLYSIELLKAMRTSGIPVVGNIFFKLVERGQLTMERETDLDDEFVMRWWDDNEPRQRGKKEAWGNGPSFSWTRYTNPNKPQLEEDDEL